MAAFQIICVCYGLNKGPINVMFSEESSILIHSSGDYQVGVPGRSFCPLGP